MKTIIVLLALVSVCASTLQAQSVKTTTTKGVDLTKYETFTVVKGELMTPPDERMVSNETLFKSFRKTINTGNGIERL